MTKLRHNLNELQDAHSRLKVLIGELERITQAKRMRPKSMREKICDAIDAANHHAISGWRLPKTGKYQTVYSRSLMLQVIYLCTLRFKHCLIAMRLIFRQ
jgi:hypothetical protein